MKKLLVLVLAVVVGYFAYQDHQKKQAAGMLQEARTLIKQGEFDEAKIVLGDLLFSYHWTESAASAEELHGNLEEMRRDYRRKLAREERARQRREDQERERREWTVVPKTTGLEPPPTPWDEASELEVEPPPQIQPLRPHQ